MTDGGFVSPLDAPESVSSADSSESGSSGDFPESVSSTDFSESVASADSLESASDGDGESAAETTAGRRFTDLRAFERDVLYAVRELEREEEGPKGIAVKKALERHYDEEVNRSRLYQNLDTLVDAELLTKRIKDARTNEYATTEAARLLLARNAKRRADTAGLLSDEQEAPAPTAGSRL